MIIGFLGCLHLRAGDPPIMDDRLCGLLEYLDRETDETILMGDVLEMYEAGRNKRRHFHKIGNSYPRSFWFIEDHKIKLINGNHDDECLNLFRHHTPVNLLIHDGVVFLHGHQADMFFKSRIANAVSEFFTRLTYRVSPIIAMDLLEKQREERVGVDAQARYAREFLSENNDIHGIVMAHTHVPVNSRNYINVGSYLNGDYAILDTKTMEATITKLPR